MRRDIYCKYHCDVCETVVECVRSYQGDDDSYGNMIQYSFEIQEGECECCKNDPNRAPSMRLREHSILPEGVIAIWDERRL